MTKPLTPGERVQNALEMYRGAQKQPRPQHIEKPKFKVSKPSKQTHKSSRGR